MKEYYPGIPKVKYEGPQSDNPFAYKFYNPEEIVAGKSCTSTMNKVQIQEWNP